MARTVPWSLAAPGDLAPGFAADAARWRRDLGWDTRDLWDAVERARVAGRLDGLAHVDDAGHLAGWAYFVARDGDLHCGAIRRPRRGHRGDRRRDPGDAGGRRCRPRAAVRLLAGPGARRRAAPSRLRPRAVRLWGAGARRAVARRRAGPHVGICAISTPRRRCCSRPTRRAIRDARSRRTARRASGGSTVNDLVMGQGCGRFRPTLSLAVPDDRGRLDAVALVTDLGEGTAHLAQIGVGPRLRGAGVGAAMLDEVTRRAAAAGCSRVSLLVARDNQRATAMYARAGFAVQASFLCAVRPGRRMEGLTDVATTTAAR